MTIMKHRKNPSKDSVGTDHFMWYSNEYGESEELRTTGSKKPVRLYLVPLEEPRWFSLVRLPSGRWVFDQINKKGKRSRKMSGDYTETKDGIVTVASKWEHDSENLARKLRASQQSIGRNVGGERHYPRVLVNIHKSMGEYIDLRDGRWTQLWAGLEYGPAPSLEAIAPDAEIRKTIQSMVAKGEYTEFPSVAAALARHYDRPERNPSRKTPAMTPAEIKAAVPTHEIDYLVGTYHVSTPSEEIEARIRSLATKAKWPSPVITAAVLYARKAHQKNVDLFRSWRF